MSSGRCHIRQKEPAGKSLKAARRPPWRISPDHLTASHLLFTAEMNTFLAILSTLIAAPALAPSHPQTWDCSKCRGATTPGFFFFFTRDAEIKLGSPRSQGVMIVSVNLTQPRVTWDERQAGVRDWLCWVGLWGIHLNTSLMWGDPAHCGRHHSLDRKS